MSNFQNILDKIAEQEGDINPVELLMEATIAKRKEAKKKSKKKDKEYNDPDPIPAPDDFMNLPVED